MSIWLLTGFLIVFNYIVYDNSSDTNLFAKVNGHLTKSLKYFKKDNFSTAEDSCLAISYVFLKKTSPQKYLPRHCFQKVSTVCIAYILNN